MHLLLVHCMVPALASTGGYMLPPPSVRTTGPAIKDAYFLCLVNELSFQLIYLQGGGVLDSGILHYMAFAKTQKRGVVSVYFKLGLKLSSFQKLQNFCRTTHFCLSCELPGIEPGTMAKLPTTLTSQPNTQVKECCLCMSVKPFRSAEW